MVEVSVARTKREIREFVVFPLSLYKDNPYYVPDMVSSQVNDLLEDKNPAFEYCKARCFVARRNGEIVGRVCGIWNRLANEKDGHNYLRFSHFDFIDDAQVTDALYAALESYARELGCTAIHGPQGFTDMDREGMLIRGFDRLSQFFVWYNYPYYIEHMERLGFVKEVDWLEYLVHIPAEEPPRLKKIADFTRQRYHLHVADLSDKKHLKKYIRDVFALYNEAYPVLFGMVPLTDKQIEKYVGEFKPLVTNRTSCFVYNENEELVAFAVASPSISYANQKNGGRLFPFGFIPLLRALYGKNNRVDMFLIAVKPSLKGTGLSLIVIEDLLKKAIAAGVTEAETGPQLETNINVRSLWELFETEQHKQRRCYIKMLSDR